MTRTRTVAILLALFLGFFGAHKFYLGRPIQGTIYFLLSETGIPSIISIFEAIRYIFMTDSEFNREYN